MIALSLTFVLHRPYVLNRQYNYFCIGRQADYFDQEESARQINAYAERCYLPATHVLQEALSKDQNCCFSFDISDTLLMQLQQFRPDVIPALQGLFASGQVEMLGSTGCNSLALLYSEEEFMQQSREHHQGSITTFGAEPQFFLNSEMIYGDYLSAKLEEMSYKGALTEGTEKVLGWRSGNMLYRHKVQYKQSILFRNHHLSNLLAFGFADTNSHTYPITAEKFLAWVLEHLEYGDKNKVVNMVIDYETFGFYQPLESGILAFLAALFERISEHPDIYLTSPSKTAQELDPVAKIGVPQYVSWAGDEQDIAAWTGNNLQLSALEALYALEEPVKSSGSPEHLQTWRLLQAADYFQCMDTRWSNTGFIPHRFTPFANAEEAYIIYNNMINDFTLRLDA